MVHWVVVSTCNRSEFNKIIACWNDFEQTK